MGECVLVVMSQHQQLIHPTKLATQVINIQYLFLLVVLERDNISNYHTSSYNVIEEIQIITSAKIWDATEWSKSGAEYELVLMKTPDGDLNFSSHIDYLMVQQFLLMREISYIEYKAGLMQNYSLTSIKKYFII